MLDTNICMSPSTDTFGAFTVLIIVSNKGFMSVPSSFSFNDARPCLPEAYTTGKSNCSSLAATSKNKS